MRQLKITKQVTNRETASLDKYLQEIGKVDLITAEEEVEPIRVPGDGKRPAVPVCRPRVVRIRGIGE